jgi:rhodanese-related sulfurtransferase
MTSVPELQPTDLARDWPNDDIMLLDVREPVELSMAAIDGAVHIPMAHIPSRLSELDNTKTIVVMCHGGVRSMAVAQLLKSSGFENVLNLAGGIDAWARHVDAAVPRY